jgi:hypothetical protein
VICYLLFRDELQASPADMPKLDESGNVRVKDLVYLAACGLVAIAIYLVWQALGLSNSHVKPGHETDSSESLNDH